MKSWLFCFGILLCACNSQKPEETRQLQINDPHFKATVVLKKLETMPGYKLSVEGTNGSNDLHIKDSIYRFELADVDGNGETDILLGITKKTHFEPVMEKRLQLFRIDSGKIRPLWLGSKLCFKLIDFKPVFAGGNRGSGCEIATIEQDAQGFYCNGRYTWQNFGLRLIAYTSEKTVYSKAQQFFQHEH